MKIRNILQALTLALCLVCISHRSEAAPPDRATLTKRVENGINAQRRKNSINNQAQQASTAIQNAAQTKAKNASAAAEEMKNTDYTEQLKSEQSVAPSVGQQGVNLSKVSQLVTYGGKDGTTTTSVDVQEQDEQNPNDAIVNDNQDPDKSNQGQWDSNTFNVQGKGGQFSPKVTEFKPITTSSSQRQPRRPTVNGNTSTVQPKIVKPSLPESAKETLPPGYVYSPDPKDPPLLKLGGVGTIFQANQTIRLYNSRNPDPMMRMVLGVQKLGENSDGVPIVRLVCNGNCPVKKRDPVSTTPANPVAK